MGIDPFVDFPGRVGAAGFGIHTTPPTVPFPSGYPSGISTTINIKGDSQAHFFLYYTRLLKHRIVTREYHEGQRSLF